jgi:hypothetical protein
MNLPSTPPPRKQQQKQRALLNYHQLERQTSTEERLTQGCVMSFSTLRRKVRSCNKALNANPCVINICKNRIQIRPKIEADLNPIQLSNKNVVIKCLRKRSKRCIIDGMGRSGIFFDGSKAFITFVDIIFANSGGALNIGDQSLVNLFNCSFVNHSAETTRGAITIKGSSIYMAGSKSSFINNTGMPPIFGIFSQINLYDTLFRGNQMTPYVCVVLKCFVTKMFTLTVFSLPSLPVDQKGKDIFMLQSLIELYNTTFSESTDASDCNVFVAGNGLNLTDPYGASCLDVSNNLTK